MKNYSDSIKLERWKDLANLTELRKNINEGGTISHSAKAPNGVTYGIIRENSHYFIKYTDKDKEVYGLGDYKYLGGLNNIREGRFDSYSSALKRLNGMFNVLKEDIKYQESIDELTSSATNEIDDDNLFGELEALDNTEVKPEETPVSEPPVTEPITNEIPTDSEAPVSEPPVAEPTLGGDETPKDGAEDSSDSYTEIQSLLGKMQNVMQNMETITPQQTKSIMNSVISSTKTGLSNLEDSDKEKISNRILHGGEKMDENIEETKNWIQNALSDHKEGKLHDKLGIPKEEKISKERLNSELDKLKGKELTPEELTLKKELILAKSLGKMEEGQTPTQLSESIKFVVEQEIKRTQAKKILKESLIQLKESKTKELDKKKAIFYETFQKLSESEYDNALSIVKQYLGSSEGTDLNEGVFGDKLKTLAKPFVIAALMSVMGGEVSAAVNKYKEATGITPTEQEIKAGVNEFNKQGSSDVQSGPKDQLDKLMKTPNVNVVKISEKKLDNNGKKKFETYSIKLPSKLVDERGPRLQNKDVMSKEFSLLDDSKDSERMEKVWRIINFNPDEAITTGIVKNSKGEVLANNVKLEGDNVVYDFVFKNKDSNDYTDGTSPVKVLAGKLKQYKSELQLSTVWALYKNAGVYNINPNMMKEDPSKLLATIEKLIKAGYEPIQGTYNWQRSDKGAWVEANEAVKLFKDGQIRFNDEGLNKEYMNLSKTSQTSNDFTGQGEPVVK